MIHIYPRSLAAWLLDMTIGWVGARADRVVCQWANDTDADSTGVGAA